MSNLTPQPVDVAIIGAGPVGLFAVFQCGMLGLSTCVIDSLPEIGGQCTALYPEKPIYDIPGFPNVAAGDLIANLEAQAAPFKPLYHLGQTVQGLDRNKLQEGWVLATSSGRVIQARTVLIAAGGGAFGPNRPPLTGIEAYEGKSVFYMVRRRDDLRGRRVVIAGGGDSAVDWALSLVDVAASVMVVHRRDQFRAAPDNVARMKALAGAGKINMVVPYQLHGLDGTDGRLSAVLVHDLDGHEKRLEADVLLPFFGLAASLGPLADWGLKIEHHHIVVDPATAETGLPGIYAIGDIVAYSNKLKLILTGFAEAAQAAHAIYRRLHPGQELHMEYSTTKGLPGG
ncbi:MAG: NAD(P)/FAD-dependent oxidoreductase [Micavibrio sp.]